MKIHHFDGIYQERWGFSWRTVSLPEGRSEDEEIPGRCQQNHRKSTCMNLFLKIFLRTTNLLNISVLCLHISSQISRCKGRSSSFFSNRACSFAWPRFNKNTVHATSFPSCRDTKHLTPDAKLEQKTQKIRGQKFTGRPREAAKRLLPIFLKVDFLIGSNQEGGDCFICQCCFQWGNRSKHRNFQTQKKSLFTLKNLSKSFDHQTHTHTHVLQIP